MKQNNPLLPELSSGEELEKRMNAVVNTFVGRTSEVQADSFINIDSFGNYVDVGNRMEPPRELFKHIVVEHETTIFFGDTGVGKTILAMQMALDIANMGKRVLYVNFELSQQQLAQRFHCKDIPDTLLIANINYALMHDVTEQSQILEEIEKKAIEHNTSVIFIDNLTNLCINSKESSEAGKLVLQLISLRMKYDWTLVILAHVPKRKYSDPLTLNDVAGSKLISNFVDNVVGINKSKQGENKRYIIQLKYRSFTIELDSKNVQELTRTTSDGYLHFEFGDYDEERMHLPRSRDEKAELEREIVKELRTPNGLSYRQIADKLNTTHSKVSRIAKEYDLCHSNDKKKAKADK